MLDLTVVAEIRPLVSSGEDPSRRRKNSGAFVADEAQSKPFVSSVDPRWVVSRSMNASALPQSTSGTSVEAQPIAIVEPIWQDAVRNALQLVSPQVREQAVSVMRSRAWRASWFTPSTPHVAVTSDGALKLEWVGGAKRDRRLTIFFEEDPKDSGWTFVAVPNSGIEARWGRLDDLDPQKLFGWLRR